MGDGTEGDELAMAELVATNGPIFDLTGVAENMTGTLRAELVSRRVRHCLSSDGDLIVHRNDAETARGLVAATCGSHLEVEREERDEHDSKLTGEAETIYTAGDLYQANLVRARLGSVGIDSRLVYDPLLGVAAYLAKDATVKVQVAPTDVEAAESELDGDRTDHGSDLPFRSQAWATPVRRLGARSLLLALGLYVLPILIVVAFVLYEFVAP